MKKQYLLLLFLNIIITACQPATSSIQLQKDINTIQQHTSLALKRIEYFNDNLKYESNDRPMLRPFCMAIWRINKVLDDYNNTINRLIQELEYTKDKITLPIFLAKKDSVFKKFKQEFQDTSIAILDTLKQDSLLKSITIATKLDSLFEPLRHSFDSIHPILVDYKKQTWQEMILGLSIEQNQLVNAVLETNLHLSQLIMQLEKPLYALDIEAINVHPITQLGKPFEVTIKPVYLATNATFKMVINRDTISLPMSQYTIVYQKVANKIGDTMTKITLLLQNLFTGEMTAAHRDIWYQVIPKK